MSYAKVNLIIRSEWSLSQRDLPELEGKVLIPHRGLPLFICYYELCIEIYSLLHHSTEQVSITVCF